MMIPISEWAKKNKINRTTALEWARREQIKAEKTIVQMERWFIDDREKIKKNK